MNALLLFGWLAVPASAKASASCVFHDIVAGAELSTASATTVLETKNYRLSIDGFDVDEPSRPKWEGWLRVERSTSSCVIEQSIISGLHLDETGEYVLVNTYSGSESWGAIFRLRDCKALVKNRSGLYWDKDSKRLLRNPFCYDYICTRGLRYDLNESCQPTLNEKDSDAWTKRVYGVLIPGDSLKVTPDSPLITRSKEYWDAVNEENN
ncbi:MAG: hypothetical protein HYZ75_13710 [Elusimicrobia bacterium]|nr:hypothetical protein [Elusimicrobiota bacterium]